MRFYTKDDEERMRREGIKQQIILEARRKREARIYVLRLLALLVLGFLAGYGAYGVAVMMGLIGGG